MIILATAFGGLGLLFIVSLLKNDTRMTLSELFSRALAIGIALTILLVSGLNALGYPLTKFNISIALLASCGMLIFRLLTKRSRTRGRLLLVRPASPAETVVPFSLFLVLIVLRLIQIRDVVVPPWYDGFLLTSFLQEYAINSVVPFLNGFSALSLTARYALGISLPQTILLLGQWLSIIAAVSYYRLAQKSFHNPFAAGLSCVIYSLILLFPSLLISWASYPYLLALVLLPPAILATRDWIDQRRDAGPEAFMFITALGLSHLGSLLIWFSFALTYLVKKVVSGKKLHPNTDEGSKVTVYRPLALIVPVLIVMLASPMNRWHESIPQPYRLSQIYTESVEFGIPYILRLFRAHDFPFICLGIFGILWSAVWNRKTLHLILLWPLMVWFFTWLQYQMVRDPLLSYINLLAFLSIPLSLSVGVAAQSLLWLFIRSDLPGTVPQFREKRKNRLSSSLSVLIVLGVVLSPLSIDQRTVLFTNEDLLAMQWIKDHTAKDAGFLIRSTNRGNMGLIPADGGGWIPFLTDRRTVIPQTGELYDICSFAADHDIAYLYFGKQRDDSGFDLRRSDLDPSTYVVVYGSSLVEILALRCSLGV